MKFKKGFWIKLGIESLLIVFSVLLALALNEYRADRKEDERTKLALLSIREELQSNQEIIEEWLENHRLVLQNINQLMEQPEGYDSLIKNHQFQFNMVFRTTLADNLPSNTAWETAKSTGSVQNFDLELVNGISSVYELQRLGPLNSIEKFVNMLSERQTHQREYLPETMVVMRFTMAELVGQEEYILMAYKDMLKTLDAATLEE